MPLKKGGYPCIDCGKSGLSHSGHRCRTCFGLSIRGKRPNAAIAASNAVRTIQDEWSHIQSRSMRHYYRNREAKLARHREWVAQNREHVLTQRRDQRLRKTYGLSTERYRQMERDQNWCCAICGQPPCGSGGRNRFDLNLRLAVDHDHKTGVVRGLLCTKCNTLLGLVNDDVLLLESAISYVKEFDGINATAV